MCGVLTNPCNIDYLLANRDAPELRAHIVPQRMSASALWSPKVHKLHTELVIVQLEGIQLAIR